MFGIHAQVSLKSKLFKSGKWQRKHIPKDNPCSHNYCYSSNTKSKQHHRFVPQVFEWSSIQKYAQYFRIRLVFIFWLWIMIDNWFDGIFLIGWKWVEKLDLWLKISFHGKVCCTYVVNPQSKTFLVLTLCVNKAKFWSHKPRHFWRFMKVLWRS